MIYIFAALGACVFAAAFWIFIRHYMNKLVERRIASYQNDLVARHCTEVENIYKTMRGWRHDYHNHIQAMLGLIDPAGAVPDDSSLRDTLKDYLLSLNSDLTSVDTILKTGNVMADAILNSKLSLARSKNITVKAKATIPNDRKIQDIDLCVIIGNLLDNAIEASLRLPDEHARFIRIYIGLHKDLFYISVSNSMGSDIRKSGQNYLTTKNSATHGFGLVRVDKIAEKYGGFVNRQHESGVFATEIVLPL